MNGQLKSIVIIAILAVGIAAAYIYRKPPIDEPVSQHQPKELWLTGEEQSEVASADAVKPPGKLPFKTNLTKPKIPESVGRVQSIQQTAKAEGFPQPAAPLMKVEQSPRHPKQTAASPPTPMREPESNFHISEQAIPGASATNFEPMAQFGSTLSPLDEQNFYQPGDIVPPQINGNSTQPQTQTGMVRINPDPVASNQNVAAPQVVYPKNNLIRNTSSRVTIRSLQNSRKLIKHVIRDGDSLHELAARYLGDANRSGEIFQSNRDLLISPEILPIGKRLKIFVD